LKEKNLSKLMGQAINDYNMIKADDRIIIGLSGGMDSLAMLLLLHSRLARIPIKFELFPAFVDNFNGENEEHNKRISRLADFVRQETGLETHIIRVPTIRKLTGEGSLKRDTCFLCAQKRRTELLKYAFSLDCNKLALGHHKDDIIETTLMNLFYKRELSSMLPRLPLFNGKLDIIRPLAYIQKHQIESFIYERENVPPIFGEVCPSQMVRRDSRRLEVRELLKSLSGKVPNLKNNIFASFRNPKKDYLLDHCYEPKTSGTFKRP
jgi:tRNA 2-thiocytidine biosynthesis protein TtcA